MYANTQNGQVTIAAVAPNLSTYRRALMDVLAEATQVITDAEYERAVGNILACQSLATLQKWYRNTVREIADREEALPQPEPVQYATAEQKEEVIKLGNSTWILRKEKTAALLKLPRLDKAGATALIGALWAKILHRQERAAEGMAEASESFLAVA